MTEEQARQAMMEEGGTPLGPGRRVQLRFATEEEAEACRQRLIRRFPGSDDVWVINRENSLQDFAKAQGSAEVGEE